MIRVLLADDHAVVRMGFRLLLQSHAEVSVVGEADSGEAACQRYDELSPDVLVMDLAMPGMGGLELQRRIKADFPALRVIIVTGHPDGEIRDRALMEGAFYFLHKPFDGTELLRVLAQALNRLPGQE